MNLTHINAWIDAIRPRTLPLAMAAIILGGSLAHAANAFRWDVFLLALFTTLFLQILSNLANDYGDTMHAVDNDQRIGPRRTVQSGRISKAAMRKGITVTVLLSLATGLPLVWLGTRGQHPGITLLFLLLGFAAIGAAIKYTAGSKPYGYSGYGDVFVFLFFGLASVLGSYFLISGKWDTLILLPATAMGCLSTAVLNLNNMRDHENDALSGKRTLVVKRGVRWAKRYHLFLITASVMAGLTYMLIEFHSPYQLLFLITLPLFVMHLHGVFHNHLPEQLDPYLKKLALTSLLFALSFGIGLLF